MTILVIVALLAVCLMAVAVVALVARLWFYRLNVVLDNVQIVPLGLLQMHIGVDSNRAALPPVIVNHGPPHTDVRL